MELDERKLNDIHLVHMIIKSDLQQAGISLKRIGFDFKYSKYNVTTDKNIPEKIKSRICQYAKDKGMTIHFQIL